MFFLVNNGPFAGEDGKAVTLRQIKERLERELRTNVALRVEDVGRADGVKVSGRGELHLAILIEEMRREGMELCVSRPEVITHRDANGQPAGADGAAHHRRAGGVSGRRDREAGRRKGELVAMDNHGHRPGAPGVRDPDARPDRLPQRVPDRHARAGHHVLALHRLRPVARARCGPRRAARWSAWRRRRGHGYPLENLQERATLFVEPMERVYAGQIVGENSRGRRHAVQPHQAQGARQLPGVRQGASTSASTCPAR